MRKVLIQMAVSNFVKTILLYLIEMEIGEVFCMNGSVSCNCKTMVPDCSYCLKGHNNDIMEEYKIVRHSCLHATAFLRCVFMELSQITFTLRGE